MKLGAAKEARLSFLKAPIIQRCYGEIKYKASNNKWYKLADRFPNCISCSSSIDPEGVMVCLDNAEPQGPEADFRVAKIEYNGSSIGWLYYQLDGDTFQKVTELQLPSDALVDMPVDKPYKFSTWEDTVGKYIVVSQEIKIDGSDWIDIEFEGWVARVDIHPTTVVLDSGESWVVEGDPDVRASIARIVSHSGKPAWERRPDRWMRVGEHWELVPIAPKLPGCNCSKCSFYENTLVDDRSRHKKCDILFVGEAPGWEEARSDPPEFFIGQSGRLLRALFDQTGVSDFTYGFNNATICYGSDTPSDEDLKACNARLLREIAEADPKLVVAVGARALQALTNLTGITEHQGALIDWEVPGDQQAQEAQKGSSETCPKKIKLLACFHPAAVLRRPDLFYSFAETIYKAALYLKGDNTLDVQPKDIEVVFCDDESTLQRFREESSLAECFYADIETSDYSPYKARILCLALSWKDFHTGRASRKSYVFSWDFIERHKVFFELLFSCSKTNYWNAFFDAQFIKQHGLPPTKVGDIMLKQYTLDESPLSQALKGCARRYCNAPDWEEPLKQYLPSKNTSFEVIPVDVLYLYNGYDAAYTGVLDDVLSARMDEHNWNVYNTILVPALEMFLDICAVGMKVDLSKLDELRAELRVKMDNIRRQISSMVIDSLTAQLIRAREALEKISQEIDQLTLKGSTIAASKEARQVQLLEQVESLERQIEGAAYFNPSSIRDARMFIHDVLGLNTEGNSTSRTALEDYKDVPGVSLLLQYREARKLLGTYVEGLVDDLVYEPEEGPDRSITDKVKTIAIVHPNIRLNGTVTGRLSSANPNLFGIPDEKGGIKKLYSARWSGWGIGDGDGAQMEVRVLGALSNDRQMIADFQAGVDFHGAARNRLYGRGFDKKNYSHQEVLDAKTAVFGPIYGRGAESLARQFYHSEIAALKAQGKTLYYPTWASLSKDAQMYRIAQAQEHIDKLWAPYPTALNWLKANVEKAQKEGELRSWYGRYRHWGLITEELQENVKTQGRNFPVQSPSSDTNLLIMVGSYHKFPRSIYLPLFPVHDAVVFAYRLGEEKGLIPELKAYYEKRAQELLQTDMRFVYEFSTGPTWGEQTTWSAS